MGVAAHIYAGGMATRKASRRTPFENGKAKRIKHAEAGLLSSLRDKANSEGTWLASQTRLITSNKSKLDFIDTNWS